MSECCDQMQRQVDYRCSKCGEDCPDQVVAKFGHHLHGIPIRDGSSSFYTIDYCPWCGKALRR